MFFNISDRFTPGFQPHRHDEWVVNLDTGWQSISHQGSQIYYKGYSESADMKSIAISMAENPVPRYKGNFAVIIVEESQITITNDVDRAFPIYMGNDYVSNIVDDNHHNRVWTSSICRISKNWENIIDKCNLIDVPDIKQTLSVEQAADELKSLLIKKTNAFLKYNNVNEINFFITGGLDVLSCLSLFRDHVDKIKIIDHEYFHYDTFTRKNRERLKKYWGYRTNSIHHWLEESWLASGSGGDEYGMRGPLTVGLWTAWHDINLLEVIKDYPFSYHYHYYINNCKKLFEKLWSQRFEIREKFPNYQDFCVDLINNLSNDYQHWHLGRTLTWTPLRDSEVLKIYLRLRPEEMLKQMLDGAVSKEMIASIDQNLLCGLSYYKSFNSRENVEMLTGYLEILQASH